MRSYLHDCGTPAEDDCCSDRDARSSQTYWSEADDTWDVEQIEQATGTKIGSELTGEEEKRKLQEMDKGEIIDMLLKAKVCHLKPSTLSYHLC